MFAISVFIVGSALCSFATSMYELAAFRAFQGLGAGGLFTLVLAIIGDIVSPRERAKYTGYFMAMFATSSVLGPVVGGFFAGQDEILGDHRLALGLPGQRADRHRRPVRGVPHPAPPPRRRARSASTGGAPSPWSSPWCRCSPWPSRAASGAGTPARSVTAYVVGALGLVGVRARRARDGRRRPDPAAAVPDPRGRGHDRWPASIVGAAMFGGITDAAALHADRARRLARPRPAC